MSGQPMSTPETGLRYAQGSITADALRALPEGAVILTHGVAWAKIGPDVWRCPFRQHVPDTSISPRWKGQFRWHDEKSSEWLAEVASTVIYDPNEWAW